MSNQQIFQEIIIQIAGFLVVFWVLKKFAWGPLLGMVDKRRETIMGAFKDIESQKKALEALEVEYRKKLSAIEDEARSKIQEAARQGADLSKEIQDKARADAQKLIDRAHSEIEHDLVKAKLTLRNELAELSAEVTEKVIRARLTAEDHKRLVSEFVKDLERMKS